MKVGDAVKLKKGRSRKCAVIVALLDDVEGGVRLDQPLDGFRFWNVLDLQKCAHPPGLTREGFAIRE